MENFAELPSVPSDHLVPFTDQLRLAVAAYLARFKGASRYHTESDLRCYLTWCTGHGLDPLAARRPHLELYIRWMQEIRRFKPSTVSRRLSVRLGSTAPASSTACWTIHPLSTSDGPSVPPESPNLGFTHLQFEALLTAARESPHPCDFALVAMLGLLGLRIFEATGADVADLGEEHGELQGEEYLVFEGFTLEYLDVGEVTLRVRHGGQGQPVVLLHGHPRTHTTWHRVAPQLPSSFFVVCPDLRGYGQSTLPADAPRARPVLQASDGRRRGLAHAAPRPRPVRGGGP